LRAPRLLPSFPTRRSSDLEAARLIRAAAGRTPEGPTRVALPPLPAGSQAFGVVEAWRGPVWHWVVADGPATLRRVKIVDPSFRKDRKSTRLNSSHLVISYA